DHPISRAAGARVTVPTIPQQMVDLRYVKKLIEMLDQSNVDSIEISTDKGVRIRLSKSPARGASVVPAPVQVAMNPVDTARLTPAAGMPTIPEPAAAAAPSAPAAPKYLELKSPMVGTFYAAPEP